MRVIGDFFQREGKTWTIFQSLSTGGEGIPDGEGNPMVGELHLYPDGKAVQLIKEHIPAASSKLSEFLSTYEHLSFKDFPCPCPARQAEELLLTATLTLFAEKSWGEITYFRPQRNCS